MTKTYRKKIIIPYVICAFLAVFILVLSKNLANGTDNPKLSVSSVYAKSGDSVNLTLKISNNPGYYHMSLKLEYDKNYLTLTKVSDSGLFGNTGHGNSLTDSPYVLCWKDTSETVNVSGNGTMVSFNFTVSDNCPVGSYPITVSYNEMNTDIYNVDLTSINFEVSCGGIQVLPCKFGDVNNDATINPFDATIIKRSISQWDGYSEQLNSIGADTNNDGTVNPLDATILSRYISGWAEYQMLPYPYVTPVIYTAIPTATPVVTPTPSPTPYIDPTLRVQPDTWDAVDGLGRNLSSYGDSYSSSLRSGTIGDKNDEKFVGMFYWTWHHELSLSNTNRNITTILSGLTEAEKLAVRNDYYNPIWCYYTGYHFWDEPIFGYYSTIDKYVLRKQAELLADAGVDVIIFDCTNGEFTWSASYNALMNVFSQARKEGVKTPQIAFMFNFAPCESTRNMMTQVYENIYKPERYKDLWFYWKGKPLVIGYENSLYLNVPLDKEIHDFFTFRNSNPSYFTKWYNSPYWGWLSTYPQALYKNSNGSVEQTSVSVAQNANYATNRISDMNGPNVMGRSYAKGTYYYNYLYNGVQKKCTSTMANSTYYGLNFQQQWDYAINNNPEFVFVTGWNEWVARRLEYGISVENAFVDEYSAEYSRDIEPSKGELKDYYYYQLTENIRRFKGVSAPETTSSRRTIDINGALSQWDGLTSYESYYNSTYIRSVMNGSTGYGISYTNNTMRNDIVSSKVAYDDNYIYFNVNTAKNLTAYSDYSWMRLFIDTDQSGTSSNWEGFEYVINRVSPTSNTCTLERSTGGWNWTVSSNSVEYKVSGNILQIAIPRSALGMSNYGKPGYFTFKWSDNMQVNGDIMDFYTNGDVAPGGRFTFVYDPTRSD